MPNPTTVTIWILDAADDTGRIVASFPTLSSEALPIGGFACQGLTERAPRRRTVPVGSPDAESATNNSRLISV